MECAGGFGAMAYVPGLVAVTIAATAGLSLDCRGRSTEVSRARKVMCVRACGHERGCCTLCG